MKNFCLLTASLASIANNVAYGQHPQRPNVILIYADDLGYGDLSCNGATRIHTPNVDRLASSGCRFTEAYSAAATSTPSRYGLLTGEYPWRRQGTDIAAGNAGMIIRPERYTLADLFRSEGYATGAFGKWHLGLGDKTAEQDWNAPLPMGLSDIGFDESYIMAATADRVPSVFIENNRVAQWDSLAPIYVSYSQPFPGVPTAKEHPELCYNQRSAFGHSMAIVNGIGRIGYMKGGGKALWKDENIADSITSHALTFMKKHRNEPFFMYLATNDVHVPRFPHPRFRGKSDMGMRGDAILQLDWTVGAVLDALKKMKLENNTIVILSSDNGAVINDGYVDQAEELLHGHTPSGDRRGNKYSAFDGGTHIPFIVSWPGKIKAGSVSKALVSQIDFLATFASLLQAQLPEGAAPDSSPAWDVWSGKQSKGREWVVGQAADHTLYIRNDQWKYIEPSDTKVQVTYFEKVETGYLPLPQLYSKEDVHEENNVANEYPQVVYDLQQLLRRVRSRK